MNSYFNYYYIKISIKINFFYKSVIIIFYQIINNQVNYMK